MATNQSNYQQSSVNPNVTITGFGTDNAIAEFVVADSSDIDNRAQNGYPIQPSDIVYAVKSVITSEESDEQLDSSEKIEVQRYLRNIVTSITPSGEYYQLSLNSEHYLTFENKRPRFKVPTTAQTGDCFQVVFNVIPGTSTTDILYSDNENILYPEFCVLKYENLSENKILNIVGTWDGNEWLVVWAYMA